VNDNGRYLAGRINDLVPPGAAGEACAICGEWWMLLCTGLLRCAFPGRIWAAFGAAARIIGEGRPGFQVE
jgi:hypothetical protein